MPHRTPLFELHRELGATLIDFHGWEMPVRYGSIPTEHAAVRTSAGLFDLCHMGRLEIAGPDAVAWLDRVLTASVAQVPAGGAKYALICNEGGTIIDDAIFYRTGGSILLVVNASNREAVLEWLIAHKGTCDATLVDHTFDEAMIAIQGQEAVACLERVVTLENAQWSGLRYYSIAAATAYGRPVWVARTGYTGENGFEIYLRAEDASRLWSDLLESSGGALSPIGLGARDTLRLEAGMPLYGNDIDTTTDPFEAGLGFAVHLDKGDFVGREALAERREAVSRRLVGLRMAGRRPARGGMSILAGDAVVGGVTSGSPSPTLGVPIALGYVATSALDGGADLTIDVRGRHEPATVESLPFFSRVRRKRSKSESAGG